MTDIWNTPEARKRAADRIRKIVRANAAENGDLNWDQIENVATCVLYYLMAVSPGVPVARKTPAPHHSVGYGSFCGLSDREKYYLFVSAFAGAYRQLSTTVDEQLKSENDLLREFFEQREQQR